MRLVDINPRWVGAGGEGIRDRDGNPVAARRAVGLSFDCPCGCEIRGYVGFANPLDGGPPVHPEEALWQRSGDDFETLTLHPSIKRDRAKGGCGWHGWIRNGEVTGRVE